MVSKSAYRRLVAANRELSLKERQIREMLGLRVQARLSLLDESSATHVTAEDRDTLARKDGDPADRP